jgi:hypothetical protein
MMKIENITMWFKIFYFQVSLIFYEFNGIDHITYTYDDWDGILTERLQ